MRLLRDLLLLVPLTLALGCGGACNSKSKQLERETDQALVTKDGGGKAVSEDTIEFIEVKSLADIKANQGDIVQVIGLYQEVDVRKKQTVPAVLQGHVAILLDDKTSVFLGAPWSASAVRSAAERDELRDERVVVTGVVAARAPADPRGGASMQVPCMISVAGIVTEEFHEAFKAHVASP